MNFAEKIKTTYKEVTENSDALSKNLKLEMKKKIIEKINYDAIETSSKNLKVSQKSSTRSTSDSSRERDLIIDESWYYSKTCCDGMGMC